MGVNELTALARMSKRMTPRERLERLMRPSEWLTIVTHLAETQGWRVIGNYSEGAFPTLLMARGHEVLFVYLVPQIDVLGAEQLWVFEALLVGGVEVLVWRPSDESMALDRLSRSSL